MLTLISGTNRPGSRTLQVARQVASLYEARNVPIQVLDLAEMPPAIFDPASYGDKPEAFAPFSKAILQAEGLIVVTPEYNGGMPGVLKYFIDMLEFPESFERRPVCFVGLAAGLWGALRPVEQLQAIFGYRNAHIFPERVFLPRIMTLLNDEGQFTDGDVVKRLEKQAAGYIEFVERLKGQSLSAAS